METSSSVLQGCVVAIITLIVAIIALMLVDTSESKCAYRAIFSFGDSNSDTGGFLAVFPPQVPPNGMTFFNRPVGRASDGRLIIDFLAQALGLPYLSPYLQSFGSDYRHGANFASAASTVLHPRTFSLESMESGLSPFPLEVQLNQMKMFKHNVDHHHSLGHNKLPKADIFGKSLYTLYIGQNDLVAKFLTTGISGANEIHTQMISQINTFIKELYGLGGRTFMVFNLAPYGCFPAYLVVLPHNNSDIDEFGCMKSYNNVVVEYNNMLKQALNQTRQQLLDAKVIHVDIHSLFLELHQHPTSHGLKYGTRACCGFGGGIYNFDPQVFCGDNKVINGQNVKAEAFSDVYNYVSWDGIHATETANKLMTSAILNGSYFDPHFPLQNFCDLKPIG